MEPTNNTLDEPIGISKSYKLLTFDGVRKFRSIWRAIKRGRANVAGVVYPNRPFNNRKPTKGRFINERKKQIYEQLRQGR